MNEENFMELLTNLLSSDTVLRTNAEVYLKNTQETNLERFLEVAIDTIFTQKNNPQHSYLSLLLLKNAFDEKDKEKKRRFETNLLQTSEETRKKLFVEFQKHLNEPNIQKIESYGIILGNFIKIDQERNEGAITGDIFSTFANEIFKENSSYAIGVLYTTMYTVINLLESNYDFNKECVIKANKNQVLNLLHNYGVLTQNLTRGTVAFSIVVRYIGHTDDINVLSATFLALYQTLEVYEEFLSEQFIGQIAITTEKVAQMNIYKYTNDQKLVASDSDKNELIESICMILVFICEYLHKNNSILNGMDIKIYDFLYSLVVNFKYGILAYTDLIEVLIENESSIIDNSYTCIIEFLIKFIDDECIFDNEYTPHKASCKIINKIIQYFIYKNDTVYYDKITNINVIVVRYITILLSNSSAEENVMIVSHLIGNSINKHVNDDFVKKVIELFLHKIQNILHKIEENKVFCDCLLYGISRICEVVCSKIEEFLEILVTNVGYIISNFTNKKDAKMYNNEYAYWGIHNVFIFYNGRNSEILDKYIDKIVYVLLSQIEVIDNSNTNITNALYTTLYECIQYPMDERIQENIKIFLYKRLGEVLTNQNDGLIHNQDVIFIEGAISNLLLLLTCSIRVSHVFEANDINLYINAIKTCYKCINTTVQGEVFLSISTLLNASKLNIKNETVYDFLVNFILTCIFKQVQENTEVFTILNACYLYTDIVSAFNGVNDQEEGNWTESKLDFDIFEREVLLSESMNVFSMLLSNDGLNYMDVKIAVIEIFGILALISKKNFFKYVEMSANLLQLVLEYNLVNVIENTSKSGKEACYKIETSNTDKNAELIVSCIGLWRCIINGLGEMEIVKKIMEKIVPEICKIVAQLNQLNVKTILDDRGLYEINLKMLCLYKEIWDFYGFFTLKEDWMSFYLTKFLTFRKVESVEKNSISGTYYDETFNIIDDILNTIFI
ncbi:hypothetical protein EHP00_122 [Ecytonucleospora hepatopenaei]|uniref:Uncharacterized protein n=1 Tax=Ecytonucleospora hepatopenaei TaxID=646526 RepID=A0A1W0E5U9_9MICR|nr:hypothetical protein EHP00_122 [Ecytonucleospora hepatopenaei]